MAISAPAELSKTGNAFLDSLPPQSLAALQPHTRRATLSNRFTCLSAGVAIAMVRFPTGAVVSAVARLREGGVHEVGLVGRDGAVGAINVLFNGPVFYESFVQIPGECVEIDAVAFATQLRLDGALQDALLRLAHASSLTMAQSAVCNGTHSIVERSAKWLLLAHDRVAGDVIRLTHEFLGDMLNVRRAGVTEAAIHLRDHGAIAYTRGTIHIENRAKLEELSCECYTSINDHAAAVLGYDVRKFGASANTHEPWAPSSLRPVAT